MPIRRLVKKVIGAHYNRKTNKKIASDTKDVRAIKLARQTKHINPDPRTQGGREIISARHRADDVRRASKGKKRLFKK